jgi:hypothetical protein
MMEEGTRQSANKGNVGDDGMATTAAAGAMMSVVVVVVATATEDGWQWRWITMMTNDYNGG